MSSLPVQDSEREEIELLIAECEQRPGRLFALMFELIRLRNVMRVVRSRSRVNPSVAKSIALNLPFPSTASEWFRLAGAKATHEAFDPERGEVIFQMDFDLKGERTKP